MLHTNETYIQLNEHLKEAYLELGELYKELASSPNNQNIKETIELVRTEKNKIANEIQKIEDFYKTSWKRM